MAMVYIFHQSYMMAEGASGLAQPVYATDVADAIINALKMPESVGQTYDIGGPHTYEWTELYEILANVSGMKPYIMELPIENAFQVRRTPYPFAYWVIIYIYIYILEDSIMAMACSR